MSMRSPQVPCPIVPEDANVDAPARADLASLNGPSMDVAKPSALLPTPNLMKAIDVHASPPPEVPVTSLEPCAITSQQPNAPFCQSDTTNSDPMPTAMPSAGDHPVITNPNELGDPVLSVPNLSEVASRELSNECIDGKSSVPTSQSDNASPPISSSQGRPEPCLVSEDSTNEASLIHDTAHVHKSFAAPSSGDFDASDQGNGISVIPIPQSEFVSSAVKIKIASREVLEGRIASIGQLEISPNIDAVECAGADEVLKVDSVNESPRISMSIARY